MSQIVEKPKPEKAAVEPRGRGPVPAVAVDIRGLARIGKGAGGEIQPPMVLPLDATRRSIRLRIRRNALRTSAASSLLAGDRRVRAQASSLGEEFAEYLKKFVATL